MLPWQTAIRCKLCRLFKGFESVAMIPFLLISQAEMFPDWPIHWVKAGALAKIGNSGVHLPSRHQAKAKLRLHQIVLRRQPRGTLQGWDCLLDTVQVNVTITHHGEHGGAIGGNFGGLYDGIQTSFRMPDRFLCAGQLDPGVDDRWGKSRRFLCVIQAFLLAAEAQRAIAQSIVGNKCFWFQLSYSLEMWYGCGIMLLGCLDMGETEISERELWLNICRGPKAG